MVDDDYRIYIIFHILSPPPVIHILSYPVGGGDEGNRMGETTTKDRTSYVSPIMPSLSHAYNLDLRPLSTKEMYILAVVGQGY